MSRRDERPGGVLGDQNRRKSQAGVTKRAAIVAAGGLLLLAVVALAWPSISGTPGAGANAPAPKAAVIKADRVEVVYFHRTQRCEGCLWADQAARWTVKTYFRDELASGKVTFQEVDVQKQENAALVRKYRATASTLFVNYVKDGQDHIVQASDTYPYVGSLERYAERLRARIQAGLEVRQ